MRLIHAGPPGLVRIALAAGAVSAAYAYQHTESNSEFASADIVTLRSSSITRSGAHEPMLVRRSFADTSRDGDIMVLT